jgi:hypothetical protein
VESTQHARAQEGWVVKNKIFTLFSRKKTFLASTKTFVFASRAYFIYVLISLCKRAREVVRALMKYSSTV